MHYSGSGIAMGWRVLPVPVVVFERMDESSHRNFRLRQNMRDIREAIERAANLEVQVAEAGAGDLSPRAARRIYNEVTWCLEQCQNILSSDTSEDECSNYGGRGDARSIAVALPRLNLSLSVSAYNVWVWRCRMLSSVKQTNHAARLTGWGPVARRARESVTSPKPKNTPSPSGGSHDP